VVSVGGSEFVLVGGGGEIEDGGGVVDVWRVVVGFGVGGVLGICAKDEVGKIHDRKRSVEESGRPDPAHRHRALDTRGSMSRIGIIEMFCLMC